jgi:hypothetical protein
MIINNEKNREALADTVLMRMPLWTIMEMMRDNLDTHYEGLTDEEFDKEYMKVFKENEGL